MKQWQTDLLDLYGRAPEAVKRQIDSKLTPDQRITLQRMADIYRFCTDSDLIRATQQMMDEHLTLMFMHNSAKYRVHYIDYYGYERDENRVIEADTVQDAARIMQL